MVNSASPEHRAKMLAGRRRAIESRKMSPLRSDFADAEYWIELAKRARVRLAPWGMPPTAGRMEAFLYTVGVSVKAYLAWAAERDLKQFAERNKDRPLRAWQGLVLERFTVMPDTD